MGVSIKIVGGAARAYAAHGFRAERIGPRGGGRVRDRKRFGFNDGVRNAGKERPEEIATGPAVGANCAEPFQRTARYSAAISFPMIDEAMQGAFQIQIINVKEAAKAVNVIADRAAPEAKLARARFRDQIELLRSLAQTVSERAAIEMLESDQRASR
jgi:hypothetical protein